MAINYSAVDAAILDAIKTGKRQFYLLEGDASVARAVNSIPGLPTQEKFRVIDRRLQALRRAGKIAYSHACGWREIAYTSKE